MGAEASASDAPRSRFSLRKLWILLGATLAGQLFVRVAAFFYVANMPSSREHASMLVDLALLGTVPAGLALIPTLALPGTPVLDRWMRGEHAGAELNRDFFRAVVLTLIGLALAIPIAYLWLSHRTGLQGTTGPIPPALAIALAIGAALHEEIVYRLGLFTIIAWAVTRLSRAQSPAAKIAALWIANLIQALLFGMVHEIFGFTGRTPVFSIASALIDPRNIGGLILGFAYFQYGLETAILTHAIGDASIMGMTALFAVLANRPP